MEDEVKVIISSKETADVYFNNKIVRISGELGLNGFLASSKNMKWIKPSYLKNIILTVSEQQEIINAVNSFYGEKKNRICFEDDNSMNLLSLKKELIERKIPKEVYCLTGELRNESICIFRNKNKWEVFFAKNGNKHSLKVFDDESSACKYLLSILKKYIS